MITLYKALPRYEGIKAVTADEGAGYPDKDHDGDTIYINTHFAEPDAAWESCRANIEAHVTLSGRQTEEAKRQLRNLEKEAGEWMISLSRYLAARPKGDQP